MQKVMVTNDGPSCDSVCKFNVRGRLYLVEPISPKSKEKCATKKAIASVLILSILSLLSSRPSLVVPLGILLPTLL